MSALLECPEFECWQALLDDTAAADQRERCEQHLECCPSCQERIDGIEQSSEELRALAHEIGDPTLTPIVPTLVHILGKLIENKGQARTSCEDVADLYFLLPCERPGVLGMLGEYEVQSVIGQGGMGVVLKAFEPALCRQVAIKVMAPGFAGNVTARRRFTREVQAAAAVSHENIVAVHAVSEQAGLPYLVMQYVEGESVQDRLDRAGPLEVVEVVRIGLQTAAGLAAAHAKGLIHRDIKPANILLGIADCRLRIEKQSDMALEQSAIRIPQSAIVKITDFGLARQVDDVALTQTGVVAGTPEYMSPEQARGEAVDHRADLFSLGSVMYAMCTGLPPFRASTLMGVIRKVNEEEPAPVRALNPEVPAWLETFIIRLMANDPAARFKSAGEVANLLEGYLSHLHQPETAPAPSLDSQTMERARIPTRSGRHLAHLLVAFSSLFLCALVLVAVGLYRSFEIVAQPLQEPHPSAHEFHLDFRVQKCSDQLFRLEGTDAADSMHSEAEGLRISLPENLHNPGAVGLETTFPIKGNFEITVRYSLLKANRPRAGWGVGFELWVLTDTPTDEAASFLHIVRPNGANVYASTRNTVNQENRAQAVPGVNLPDLPTTANAGQLRMTRTGSEVVLSASEDPDEPFRELYRFDLGTADVIRVRLAANPGNAPNEVEVRVQDLRIRADDLSGANLTETPLLSWGRWPLAALVAGVLILSVAFVWWRSSSSRQRLLITTGILFIPMLGLAVWGITSGKETSLADASSGAGNRLVFDFRKRIDDMPALSFFGPEAESVSQTDARGLRITLPEARPDTNNVGVELPTRIQGDFVIDLGYEILAIGNKLPIPGAGVQLRINLDSPSPTWALTRLRSPYLPGPARQFGVVGHDGEYFGAFRIITLPDGKEKGFSQGVRARAEASKGRLRLARTGTRLMYLVSDGGSPYYLMKTDELGTADVELVRLFGFSGWGPADVDVRFTDLVIEADSLPGARTFSPQLKLSDAWLAKGLIVGLLFTTGLVVAGWFLLRPGRRAWAVSPPTASEKRRE